MTSLFKIALFQAIFIQKHNQNGPIFALAQSPAPVLITLPTVMGHLGVEPAFWVLPVCPHCLEVYPEKPKTRKKCTVCNTDLFKTGRTRGGKERASQEPVPELQFPYKSLALQLAEIVACRKWRTNWTSGAMKLTNPAVTPTFLTVE